MKKIRYTFLFLSICNILFAQQPKFKDETVSLIKFKDGIHHWNLEHAKRNYARFDRIEFEAIGDNFISWQNPDGGWPKNIDWLAKINIDSTKRVMNKKYRLSTLDNRNTFPQVEYLSEVYTRTNNPKYKEAAEKGLRYILSIQNITSGGWRGWDIDAITYNDEIMTGVMELFLDIKEKDKIYTWIDEKLYKDICKSFDKALDLTLRCQIVVNGEKTAWCQQHSHKTLLPMDARTFELASITANESSDVLLLLMRIKNPSKEITEAVHAGVKWLEKSKINGIKTERVPLPKGKYINQEYPYDLKVVEDPEAKPIWARFYEIETNKPFLCTRGGEKVYKLEDVDPERRTGYAWYGYWPEKVLKVYAEWKVRKDVIQ